jgi:uncharacterized protein (DUF1330 family)
MKIGITSSIGNTMSYYFLSNIQITDFDEYQKYLNEVDDIFAKYNGTYLALDDNPLLLEGKWEYTRVVIIEFKSKTDFDDWYNSEDYQRILSHRLKATESDTILIKGNN